MVSEASIVKAIKRALKARPLCDCEKYHGNQFSTAGFPDLFGCDNGRMFCFEVKRPGQKPTAIQRHQLRSQESSPAQTRRLLCSSPLVYAIGSKYYKEVDRRTTEHKWTGAGDQAAADAAMIQQLTCLTLREYQGTLQERMEALYE